MKERIEEKLGYTLEEYANLLDKEWDSGTLVEGERRPRTWMLTTEELDFCIEYADAHDLRATA